MTLSQRTPFHLTPSQREQIDAVRTHDARTMFLQQFHQAHAFQHRDYSVFGMVADASVFSRWWWANEAEFLAEAWADYEHGADVPAWSEAA